MEQGWEQEAVLTLKLSRTRITDNFINVFNGVTASLLFSYRCVLHSFLTMLVGFNFNITYELKPQVSGVKLASVYSRSFSKLNGS